MDSKSSVNEVPPIVPPASFGNTGEWDTVRMGYRKVNDSCYQPLE